MVDNAASDHYRLTLPSDLGAVEELLTWFEAIWPSHGRDGQELLRIQAQTGLVEAFSNSVRHAHRTLEPAPEIEIRFFCDATGFCLSVTDQGPHFSPEDQFSDLRRQIESGDAHPLRRERHWGLVMFIRLIDEHGWDISSQLMEKRGNILMLKHQWNPENANAD